MQQVPGYPKIQSLGQLGTENALVGEVVLQEKVDGSQFGWGINEAGEFVARSRGAVLNEASVQKLFQAAYQHAERMALLIRQCYGTDAYCYGEVLHQLKHNVLTYGRVPRNHIMLFDALVRGRWLTRFELVDVAALLDVDVVPEFYRGIAARELLDDLLSRRSYLGEEIIEGIVIKNYGQSVLIGGHVWPLFVKLVRPAFKERHEVEWKSPNGPSKKATVESIIASFNAEPRREKAYQYLRDHGQIEHQLRDIGKLIARVRQDIEEEDMETVKEQLWKLYAPEIMRSATKAIPDWYKAKLAERISGDSIQQHIVEQEAA